MKKPVLAVLTLAVAGLFSAAAHADGLSANVSLVSSAARTRSRASLTSVSARPTSVKLGRPLARCTST